MKSCLSLFVLFLFGITLPVVGQSADNIYFTSEENSRGRDIYRINIDGSEKFKLTQKLGNGHYPHNNNPRLSPDGRKILFQSDPDGHDRYTLWVMNVDGSNPTKLTQKEGLYPNWSHDGKKIIYSGRRNGVWEILMIPSAGGKEVQITTNKQQGIRPGWGAACSFHPDGKSVLITYIREKELLKLILETNKIENIGVGGQQYTYASYSRDGGKIIVNRKKDKGYDLVSLSSDGLHEKVLAKNVISYSAPVWSLSGKEVLFCGSVNGNQEIFKIDILSGIETRLTNNNAFDAMPTW